MRAPAAGAVGVVVGLGLAGLGASLRPQVLAPSAPVASCPPCPSVDPSPGSASDGADPCARQVDAAVSLFRVLVEARADPPLPFPDDLPPAYTPEGFRANLDRALRDCPEPSAADMEVDCTEYPCLLVGGRPLWPAATCSSWRAIYDGPKTEQAPDPFRTADGDHRLYATALWPRGMTPGPSDERRVRDRVERIRLDRMDALGGREITPEEQHQQHRVDLERMLSQLRERAAAGELGAQDEVDRLEQQLEDFIQASPRP